MTGEYDTEITRHADANIYIECGYEDAGADVYKRQGVINEFG